MSYIVNYFMTKKIIILSINLGKIYHTYYIYRYIFV